MRAQHHQNIGQLLGASQAQRQQLVQQGSAAMAAQEQQQTLEAAARRRGELLEKKEAQRVQDVEAMKVRAACRAAWSPARSTFGCCRSTATPPPPG